MDIFGGSDYEDNYYDGDHFEDSDDDYLDHHRLYQRHQLGRGYNVSRDGYFSKIQQSVTKEETKTLTTEDEERLFVKISSYLKRPFAPLGILTLQKLAFISQTVSADRLKEIAKIICKNVFNPLLLTDEYISEYGDFCKGFAFLKVSTNDWLRIKFEQILISEFIDELLKKFGYSQRLKQLLEKRNIPQEKKLKWLQKQTEEQRRIFTIITQRSISFLDKLFQLYPEIVYRVIEILLISDEEDGFQYLCALLEKIRYRSNEEHNLTDMHRMKLTHWERNQHGGNRPLPVQKETLTPLFERIISSSDRNYKAHSRYEG